jgi:N-acetylmuramoyl-L-alanine amidase
VASADNDDDRGTSSVSRGSSTVHVKARDMHRVGPGESLRSIANQYGVSISSLKSANQISSNSVRAGTMLAIPTS